MLTAPNTRVYNQNEVSVICAGTVIDGLMDGTPITVTYGGGEVDITEGTDGPGLNVATRQGGRIKFTLRENSRAFGFLQGLRRLHENSPVATGNCVVTTGTRDIITLGYFIIGLPGDRTTGDKKMAGVEFELVGLVIGEVDSII